MQDTDSGDRAQTSACAWLIVGPLRLQQLNLQICHAPVEKSTVLTGRGQAFLEAASVLLRGEELPTQFLVGRDQSLYAVRRLIGLQVLNLAEELGYLQSLRGDLIVCPSDLSLGVKPRSTDGLEGLSVP